jgi:hypothetical protein
MLAQPADWFWRRPCQTTKGGSLSEADEERGASSEGYEIRGLEYVATGPGVDRRRRRNPGLLPAELSILTKGLIDLFGNHPT